MEEMVKEAAKKKDPGFGAKFKKAVSSMGKKMSEYKASAAAGAKKAGKFVSKHKAHIGAGAAGAAVGAGLGALAYKKSHEKKASEVSASEMAEIVAEEMEFNDVVFEGLDKLAMAGKAKAAKGIMTQIKTLPKEAKKHYEAGKKFVGKHPGKFGLGAGAALGAGVTHAAHKMTDKD